MPKPVQRARNKLELEWRDTNKGKWISSKAGLFFISYLFQDTLEVLSYLRSLTLKLQMQALDVMYAYEQLNSVTSALKNMRELSDSEFKRIFQESTTIGKKLHGESFELEQPRVNKHQMHRNIIPVITFWQQSQILNSITESHSRTNLFLMY